jgi:hypothetical protein
MRATWRTVRELRDSDGLVGYALTADIPSPPTSTRCSPPSRLASFARPTRAVEFGVLVVDAYLDAYGTAVAERPTKRAPSETAVGEDVAGGGVVGVVGVVAPDRGAVPGEGGEHDRVRCVST